MRTLAALLVLLALLASLAAGYCLWTGFVVTASVQTVFQQIALGVAARRISRRAADWVGSHKPPSSGASATQNKKARGGRAVGYA